MPGFDPPEHHPAGGERTCRLAKWRSVPQSPDTRGLDGRFHVSWETQGRQSHGWFGHGMGPGTDKTAESDADRLFDPGNLAGRVAWVAHGSIVHLPRAEWHRQAIAFDGARVERLGAVMAAWNGARSLGEDAFERQFTGVSTSATAVRKLRAATEGASLARTHEDLARASADLAGGMQGVGLERWPAFLRDIADRVGGGQQGGATSRPAVPQPAGPLPNGYQQRPGDKILLARMMFTEAAAFPDAYAGIGWAAVNRIGSRVYGGGESLSDVIYFHGQFQGVGDNGNRLWSLSANSANLLPGNLAAWNRALEVANSILNGSLPDPTKGATTFYSGASSGGLSQSVRSGKLTQSAFLGGSHFLREAK